MRNIILLVALLFNLQLSAQIILKGYIYDDISSETLIGANIIASNGSGTVSDLEGYYELSLPNGEKWSFGFLMWVTKKKRRRLSLIKIPQSIFI